MKLSDGAVIGLCVVGFLTLSIGFAIGFAVFAAGGWAFGKWRGMS